MEQDFIINHTIKIPISLKVKLIEIRKNKIIERQENLSLNDVFIEALQLYVNQNLN